MIDGEFFYFGEVNLKIGDIDNSMRKAMIIKLYADDACMFLQDTFFKKISGIAEGVIPSLPKSTHHSKAPIIGER